MTRFAKLMLRLPAALFAAHAILAVGPAVAREGVDGDVLALLDTTAHAAVAAALLDTTAHAGATATVEVPTPAAPVATAVEAPAAVPAPVVAAETPAAPEAPPAAVKTAAVTTEAPAATAEAPAVHAPIDLSKYSSGTIVVETSERKLHLVLAHGETITYPVGVGKAGKSWSGTAYIRGKFVAPPWSPPKAVKREKPYLPDYIPGGSPQNPMGAAAMTLSVDQYAIHGTNVPSSIGGFVSFGCIRMLNKDILDLFKRVHIGTKVVVLN